MHKNVDTLLKDFVKQLSPLKKDIYSIVLHGSSVYSNELKNYQDVDLFLVLKDYDFRVLSKFKMLLKSFCKKMTDNKNYVDFMISGSGRGAIKKEFNIKKQIYMLEIFVSCKDKMILDFKHNSTFPHHLNKNSKIIMGENILRFVKYAGDTKNPRMHSQALNTLQWPYCSVIEFGFDKKIILKSSEEAVFNLVRHILEVYEIKEINKSRILTDFKNLFQKDSSKFNKLFEITLKLRNNEPINISALKYLNYVKELDRFVEEKAHARNL